LLTISLTIALVQFIVFTSYAMLASSIQVWLKNENNCRWFNRLSGSTFAGFGMALGLSDR
jgi:threonine/homoserine/homoserine lactone efflux protein